MVSPVNIAGNLRTLLIGLHSFIGRVEVDLHAEVEIGSYVCINDGVKLITGSHDVRDPDWKLIRRPIRIRDYAWVATGAVILPGVTVGRGAVVGAYSIVTKDVPDYSVATGNPARFRENIRCQDLRYFPARFLAFQTAWLGSCAKTV